MKQFLIILSALLIFTSCRKENIAPDEEFFNHINRPADLCEGEHYYYEGNRQEFIDSLVLYDHLLIGFHKSVSDNNIIAYVESRSYFLPVYYSDILDKEDNKIVIVRLGGEYSCDDLDRFIQSTNANGMVDFTNHLYRNKYFWTNSDFFGSMSYTKEFKIELKAPSDLTDLNQLLELTNTEIKSEDALEKGVYTVMTKKKSSGNAMEMANYFYESGLVSYAEPVFQYFKLP